MNTFGRHCQRAHDNIHVRADIFVLNHSRHILDLLIFLNKKDLIFKESKTADLSGK